MINILELQFFINKIFINKKLKLNIKYRFKN